jgi:hypothetical protein
MKAPWMLNVDLGLIELRLLPENERNNYARYLAYASIWWRQNMPAPPYTLWKHWQFV